MLTYTIKELVNEYLGFVNSSLETCIESHQLKQYQSSLIKEASAYSLTNGGKRLRAILALITAEAILKKKDSLRDENPALPIAMAVELVHAGSLIHDDLPCMDDDDLRRGKPSNHKVYGEATALLTGDFLLLQPLLVLNDLKINAEVKLDIISSFNLAIQKMILGQSLDLELTKKEDPDYGLTRQMEEMKTGALIRASVVEAAKAANASKEQLNALDKYSQNLGLAFQVIDDILDETASTQELGKTAGKDQLQDKQTYVKKLGLDKAREFAHDLITEAKEILKDKGLFCDKLFTVADYVILRNN